MSTRWITIIAFGTLSCSSPPGSRSDDGMVGGSTSGDEGASTTLSVEATAGTSGADGTSSGSGSTPPGSTSGDDGTSTTGTTTEPEGTTGAVEPCPPFDPPGPLAMKFDVATFQCAAGIVSCDADIDKCWCQNLFDALDVGAPPAQAKGSDAGNELAVYVDDLNTDWMDGAEARAAAVIANAETNFQCGVPTWFVLNEISAGTWPSNASYREFVVDFAAEMDLVWGKNVLIASPFDAPASNAASWAALAEHAWIGVESYLSGQEINATGNQVVWCEDQYQTSKDAYTSKGVPADRLVLFEHFGGTLTDTGWGRSGVSDAGWINAIEARSAAAASVGFAGFASYAWSSNLIHEDETARIDFIETYVAQPLP
jgi:hypothetical protein